MELLLDSKEMASRLQAHLAKVLRLQERAKRRPSDTIQEISQLTEQKQNNNTPVHYE